MKIGFISPFGPGHFNPMTALARQVQSRHHEVVYLASPVVEPLVRAIGLPFASFGQRESLSALTENVKSRLAQLSKLQRLLGLHAALPLWLAARDDLCCLSSKSRGSHKVCGISGGG